MGDRIDYQNYHFSVQELGWILFKYEMIFLLIAQLFYQFWPIALLGNVFLPILLKREATEKIKKRGQKMRLDFQEFILSFGNSLHAGYSIENAFVSAYQDCAYIISSDSVFLKECEWMISQMKNNQSIEELLFQFAKRSHVKDIQEFALVFRVAKKSGGNLSQIIQDSAAMISEKISVKQEIELLISAKKMEQKIMDVIPFLIMIYISITSKGYFDVLYHNIAGAILMTVCLSLYFSCLILSEKIIAIEMEE